MQLELVETTEVHLLSLGHQWKHSSKNLAYIGDSRKKIVKNEYQVHNLQILYKLKH